MRKTIIIHIFFAIISAIIYAEGILTKGPDLIWNMFLALVAYDAAFIAIQFKKKWFFLPVAILWLVFYPNTFYMITDLVHMHWVSDTLWNRESLHLYGLCSKYFLRGSMRNRELEFDFWLFEAQMVAGIFGYWSRLIFIESRNLYWSL